jgi:DNA-binding transcriptional regulator WhiA
MTDKKTLKLEILLDKKARFTELIRIENFTTTKHCLEIINKFFEMGSDDSYYTKSKNNKNYKYVYLSGDGEAYFVERLSEFSNGTTEHDWEVKHSISMN